MDFGIEHLESVNEVLWGWWTPYILLFAGLLYTVWTRFAQRLSLTHGIAVIRGCYDDPNDPGAISHFEALSAALSATVGLGNIGGVALAIGVGGPGALFWMWVVGLLGMALKTIEITLAMMYRDTSDPDNPSGGAMWVVDHVLGSKGGMWPVIARGIGTFFCITLVIATFTNGNMFQSWSVAELTESYFGVPKIVSGILMVVIVGAVIIGGIKRIGRVAGKLVPLMCGLYLVSACTVLAMHVTELPGLLWMICEHAIGSTEASGAFLGGSAGWAFIQGMKRAFFSNEAGQGSAPIAHAAAKTGQPAREGIVGGIGPFIDTICICTVTGLVIIATGTWNRSAIGPLQAPISVQLAASAQINGNQESHWTVSASDDVASLPIDPAGPWSVGSRFYLIAKVAEQGKHRDTGSSRIKVVGEIISKDQETHSAIQWSPITIDPAQWDGPIDTISLQSNEVYRDYAGAELTGHAFDSEFAGLGRWLVTLAAWLFAVSSMISWSYYGEQGMVYLFGQKTVLPYKILFLMGTLYAAHWIDGAHHMMVLMDLGTGAMLWANIPIVLSLGYLAVGSIDNYVADLRAGKFVRHDPPSRTGRDNSR